MRDLADALASNTVDHGDGPIAAASKARRRFYEASKTGIGIPIGESPETYEWQLTAR